MRDRARAPVWTEAGQSLVELALAMPLLLIVLIGIVDVARVFYYTTAIANAAHAAAAYAAANGAMATAESVAAKACNETGFSDYSDSPSCPGLATSATFGPGQDAVVTVTYAYRPIAGYLVSRIWSSDPLPLRAAATFPGAGQ